MRPPDSARALDLAQTAALHTECHGIVLDTEWENLMPPALVKDQSVPVATVPIPFSVKTRSTCSRAGADPPWASELDS